MTGTTYNQPAFTFNSNDPDPHNLVNPDQSLFGTGSTQGITNSAFSGVTISSANTVTNKIKFNINGIDYYLLASTSAT